MRKIEKRDIEKDCVICGEIFKAQRNKAMYCSTKCRLRGSAQVLKICEECGDEYIKPKAVESRSKYCSMSCRSKVSDRRGTPEERFWREVDKRGDDECWEWQGYRERERGGYGQIRINGKSIRTSRFSYELHNGSIPAGLFVCHSCDNPPCVNPNHLWLGTPKDNLADARAKGIFDPQMAAAKKLNKTSAREIKELIMQGISGKSIAMGYGISQQLVCDIKKSRRWA